MTAQSFLAAEAALAVAAPLLAQVTAFDPGAATEAYLATALAPHPRTDAYFEGGYWLILWGAVINIALLWLLLRLGVVATL